MNNEKFEEFCKGCIESSIENCDSLLYQFKKNKIDIEFVIESNKMSIGGSSCFKDDKYKIHINYGVFRKIHDIYDVLLHKNNEQFYKTVALEKEFDDKKAAYYMRLLMEISSKIIIFHELGHIFNGHLKYKYFEVDNRNSLEMYMLSEKNKSFPPIFSQALELNADAFAATRTLGIFTFDENISYYNEECPELIKEKSHMYLLFFIASVILFSEMGIANTRNNKQLHQLNYLPLRTRLDTLIRNSLAAYFGLNKEEKADSHIFTIEFLREVIGNIESYVNLYHIAHGLPETEYNINNNSEELDETHLKHADYLLNYWTVEVRPKLINYAHFELPY